MTDDELKKTVQELKDRQQIFDCLVAYCRGMDRLDLEMTEGAYHPDAIDDHGVYGGPVSTFIKFGQKIQRTFQDATTHSITNHSCEIDGDVAHTETYWTYTGVNKEDHPITGRYVDCRTGRYIDLLERRDGRWKIAARVCVVDCDNPAVYSEADKEKPNSGWTESKRDRTDLSYVRPLTINPARFPPRQSKRDAEKAG